MADNQSANIQALLSALSVFTRAPDKTSLENANSWLQDFQHSVNALSPFARSSNPVI
jgi:transportin-3